jgi:DNA processing protein
VSDHPYWLGFSLVPEIGLKRFNLLLQGFDTLRSAWHADAPTLRRCGLDGRALANLIAFRERVDLAGEMAKIERVGARLLTLNDPDYPPLLKTINGAPPLLYVRGTLSPDDALAVSLVGTRKATVYGREAAAYLSKELAANGVTVISGLAHGIDAAAHRAALDAGGRTLAVLGCGIDQLYPRDHVPLAKDILTRGAILSEFPIGTPPEAGNFPRRNRIISGLALGVVVVEAPDKSGALITASFAAEQGRDVFAVPGSIFSPSSAGANRLIQDGAKPVLSVKDILGEINVTYRNLSTRDFAPNFDPADENEAALLTHLSAEPIHIDDLVRLSGLSTPTAVSTLTLLELKGVISLVGHMQYRLAM